MVAKKVTYRVVAKSPPERLLQEFTEQEVIDLLTELAYDGALDGIPGESEEVVVRKVG